MRPVVLSIAGFDPGGGAGIVADVKTIEAHGCWATAVATTWTVQRVTRVDAAYVAPPGLLSAQIAAVFDDHPVAAVKIGLLGNADAVTEVARALRDRDVPIVLDPVCASTSGTRFLDGPAIARLRGELLPLVHVLTPNQEEARQLANGLPTAGLPETFAKLLDLGVRYVLCTDGASSGSVCEDLLADDEGVRKIPHRSIASDRLHGTGCLHSSSVAARLARGASVLDAAVGAGKWMERCIDNGVAFGGGGSPDPAALEVVVDGAAR